MSENALTLAGRRCVMVSPADPDRVVFDWIPRIVDKNQMVVAGVASVELSFECGEIINFKAGGKDNWLISADGFRKMNAIGAVSVIFPPNQQISDGRGGIKTVSNPYIETDTDGSFSCGYARAVAIVKSPMGEVHLIDRPLSLSLATYLKEDLAAKAEYNPTAIVWGPKEMAPNTAVELAVEQSNDELDAKANALEAKAKKEGKPKSADWLRAKKVDPAEIAAIVEKRARARVWRYLPVLGDDVGIHYDTTNPVVIRILRTVVQTQKFGARKLLGMAERNALRAAFGVYKLDPSDIEKLVSNQAGYVESARVKVPVHFHQTNFDQKQINAIRDAYAEGVQKELSFAGQPVTTDVQAERIGIDDMQINDETQRVDGEVADTPAENATGPIIVDIQTSEGLVTKTLVGKIRKQHEILGDADLAKMTVEKLKAYQAALGKAADEAANEEPY